MSITSPYHEGELAVQERTGNRHQASRTGRVIASRIIPGAIPFLARQTMALLGTLDAGGNPWASVLFGAPGFVTAADDQTVVFDLSKTLADPHDPLWSNIEADPHVGMLAIELASRRRLRVNGTVTREGNDVLRLAVAEAYPNCPMYIQRREVLEFGVNGARASSPRSGTVATRTQLELIGRADTLFVASAHPERGADMSHRGGNPGFVEVLDDRTLRIPDYAGNGMFNTLGNFVAYPRAGLLFIDFEGNRLLQLSGRPEIQWQLDEGEDTTGGTRRYWDFTIERWLERELPGKVSWELLDLSPFNPGPNGAGR